MIRQGLPLSTWPELDRNAWAGATAEGDIFDGRGAAAHWAETTRNAVIAAYGRWLGFLAQSEPSALAEYPAERLTGDRLARYLDHLAQTAGTVGQWAYFAHLRDAVRVMFPGNVPQILSRRVAQLEQECQPRSKAPRIVATPRLIELGEKLMSDAVSAGGKVADLVAYRDGLMIALLAARPIRRRAFSIVRIGVHLRQVGEEWRIGLRRVRDKIRPSFRDHSPGTNRPVSGTLPSRDPSQFFRCDRAFRSLGRNQRRPTNRQGNLSRDRRAHLPGVRAAGQPASFPALRGNDCRDPSARPHRGCKRPPRPCFTRHNERVLQ